MANTLRTIVLLAVAAPMLGRRVATAAGQLESTTGQCPATVAAPPDGLPLQQYFDGQRVELNLMERSEFESQDVDLSSGNPETCTKRDVCLLMRQLDMDFYQRARAGTLVDMDFDQPPDLDWMRAGNCASAARTRGKRYLPVTDADKCQRSLSKSGVSLTTDEVRTVSSRDFPAGCVIVEDNKKGEKKAIINMALNSTAQAGHRTSGGGKSTHAQDQNMHVLCEMDRSLTEASAFYYSPYKLKPSMKRTPALSTSCSFGMYAYLAKLRETKSSCAKILTYKTSGRFPSAATALRQAAVLEEQGHADAAAEIRKYVEEVKQKYVLIDTIANQWCPGVWNAARTGGGTCSVSRKMSWGSDGRPEQKRPKAMAAPRPKGRAGTVKGGLARGGNAGRLANIDQMIAKILQEDDNIAELLGGDAVEADSLDVDSDGKPVKVALTDDVCSNLEDESLATVLGDASDAPPDFFADAHVPDGDEHPQLAVEQRARFLTDAS